MKKTMRYLVCIFSIFMAITLVSCDSNKDEDNTTTETSLNDNTIDSNNGTSSEKESSEKEKDAKKLKEQMDKIKLDQEKIKRAQQKIQEAKKLINDNNLNAAKSKLDSIDATDDK